MTQEHDALLPLELETLHKVLPAGGPILEPRFPSWACTRCAMRSTTPTVPQCLKFQADRYCPMKAAQ